MPSRLTNERAIVIARAYCGNGHDKTNGLRSVKKEDGTQYYSESYCLTLGHKLYNNIRVKAEIEQIMAGRKAEDEISIETVTKGFTKQLKLSLDANDRPTATRVLENLGKHVGYYEKDNAQVGQERELSESEADMAKRIAAIINREGIKLQEPDVPDVKEIA